jgi:hypothetical protein
MRGLILIAFGVLYLIKPNLFRTGIWQKTSVTAKTKTQEEYVNYMKIVAIVLIVAGLALLAFDNRQMFKQQPINGPQQYSVLTNY